MKVTYDASAPTRIEVLLNPGDELEVSPELGARLLAANPQMRGTVPPPPKAEPKESGKPVDETPVDGPEDLSRREKRKARKEANA